MLVVGSSIDNTDCSTTRMLIAVTNQMTVVACSIEDSCPTQQQKSTTEHHQDHSMTVRHKLDNQLVPKQSMVQRQDLSCMTERSDRTSG